MQNRDEPRTNNHTQKVANSSASRFGDVGLEMAMSQEADAQVVNLVQKLMASQGGIETACANDQIYEAQAK